MSCTGPTRRVFLLVVGCLFAAFAQTAKRPLTLKDFDSWRSISAQQLSRDGQWLAYSYMPQEGDGDLVVRNLSTGREYRENVGATPPPPLTNPAELGPEAEPPRRNITIAFTSDGQFVVASFFPGKAAVDQARKERRRPEDAPKGGMLTIRLADGAVTRVENVKSFQVPAKGGSWVAFQHEPKPEQRPAEAAKPATGDDADQRRQGGAAGTGSSGAQSEFGSDLVLRNLGAGPAADRTLPNVTEYSIARDGKTLVFAVGSRKPEENGVFTAAPGGGGGPAALLGGKGRFTKLAWDREQTQLAFLSSKDDPDSKPAKFKVYHWDRKSPTATELVAQTSAGFPQDLAISDKGALAFSRDGKKLYIPAGKPGKSEPEPGAAQAAGDKVVMDLWHWRDDLVQPMQRIRANQERGRTYRGVYHIAEKKYVQAAGEALPAVVLTDDGRQAIGVDDRPYRRMIDFDGSYADYYWVDTSTGEKKPVAKQMRGGFGAAMQWSPDGKHALYYNDRHWHIFTAAGGAVRNATAGLPVSFADEEDDTPDPPPSNGSAGWARDSQSAIVYDRYDVWRIFADGRPPVNLTGGAGRRDKIVYRVQRIDAVDEDEDERGVDLSKPLILRGAAEETRESGFLRLRPGAAAPERLLWGAANYAFAGRAKDAETVLITASRFNQYPDLHVTNTAFAAPKKVTDGAAQMAPFAWGTSETVRFRNIDGVPLKATLFKPDNFDPSKKYPMIVYIYERLSQNLHTFVTPQPGTSINIAHYVSNGYLILTPDIVYTVGYPGQSALKCVLPAIEAVVQKGFVNEGAIGIQGHSWGGYQIAYMVTQTNRFKAAEAGAPVGNMTSAYSGIRWGSGMPRQFQYEQTQSRIGLPLVRNPYRFIENSPVFFADRVNTPLLILHNDQDDAVPWYQGIELFLALRRNEKEAYLMNYNGEFHGLRRRHNQKDWTVRMQQFFDHHLKGAPKPEWMEKGVPFLEREEEKEIFRSAYTDR